MGLKFVSHGLWSEEQNILLQHIHKKKFWILSNKCGNNLKHENEAGEPWPFMIHQWTKATDGTGARVRVFALD